ncbi:MAG: DUF6150 family protein [Bacteroidota bacterium]
MKQLIFPVILLFLFLLPTGNNNAHKPEKAAPPEKMCELRGSVFVESVAAFADYRVFVQESESFADLKVYKETARAFADQPGHWHFTDVKGFADFTIYVEQVESFADFSVAYTSFQTDAGCN